MSTGENKFCFGFYLGWLGCVLGYIVELRSRLSDYWLTFGNCQVENEHVNVASNGWGNV